MGTSFTFIMMTWPRRISIHYALNANCHSLVFILSVIRKKPQHAYRFLLTQNDILYATLDIS